MSLAAGDRDRRMIAEHLAADHRHRFALRRIDLARHDGRARLVFRQDQLAQSGARPGSQQADVVCDLEQSRRNRIDRAMRKDIGVVGGQCFELVDGAGEWKPGDGRDVPGEQPRKSRFRIEAGADGGAALRERIEIPQPGAQPRDAALDLRGIAGELLAERQRRCVLGVGAADLDDLRERLFLALQRAMQLGQRRDQVGRHACRGRYVHRGRKRVVRRLAHVDMIVGMDRLLAAELAAKHLVGAIGDHLVEVHVGLRAGAGLPHDERKMVVELAVNDLARGAGDGAAAALVQQAELAVGLGRGKLDDAECAHDRDRHPVLADAEVLQRALRLRAPVTIRRDLDRAKAVGLGACPVAALRFCR